MTHPARPRHGTDTLAKFRATWVVALLLVLLGSGLTACSSGQSAPGSPSPSGSSTAGFTAAERALLTQRGTLRVGAFNDYPPFGFVDANGQPAGIAVDYWKLVADRLGVRVEFTPVAFAEQIDGLKRGRFDSLQGIFPVPEREQWFAFTPPYFTINTHIYTDATHTDRSTLASLAGLKVAVVASDSGQQLADNAGLTTVVVDAYPDAVRAVIDGQAQAMILDQLVADYFIADLKAADKVTRVGEPVDIGLMTFPVRKDDTVLLAILTKGIAMVDHSEVVTITNRWMRR